MKFLAMRKDTPHHKQSIDIYIYIYIYAENNAYKLFLPISFFGITCSLLLYTFRLGLFSFINADALRKYIHKQKKNKNKCWKIYIPEFI